MTGNGEFPLSADQSADMRAERSPGDTARRTWSNPVVQRFSLQRTLAGSNIFPDPPFVGSFPG
jgi:hypothetical protein